MSASHTVEDVVRDEVGRGGVRIIFKTGPNWILKVENAFTPQSKTVAFEEAKE